MHKYGDRNFTYICIFFLSHSLSFTHSFVFLFLSLYRSVDIDLPYNSLIHKSWRLVIPSVICFSAIALLCAIYATYLNNRLNGFCSELRTHFTNNELPCTLLIDRFRLGNATRLVTASTSFHLVKSVSYARVFLWLLAGFVMLLRCILAADFRITEVERGEQRGRSVNVTDTDNTDNASSVKFINDADVRYYPQGNVYNATTQKLQIDD